MIVVVFMYDILYQLQYSTVQYSTSTGVLTYIGTITGIFDIDGAAQLPNRMRSSTYPWKADST